MGIISLRGSLLIGNNLVPRPAAVTTTFLTNYITSIKSSFKIQAFCTFEAFQDNKALYILFIYSLKTLLKGPISSLNVANGLRDLISSLTSFILSNVRRSLASRNSSKPLKVASTSLFDVVMLNSNGQSCLFLHLTVGPLRASTLFVLYLHIRCIGSRDT